MTREDTWCRASLSVFSQTLSAKEIARILGIEGHQLERGTPVSSRSNQVRKSSVWGYNSILDSSDTVENHIDDLLRFAEGKAKELERLAADCFVRILVSFSAESGTVKFALDPDILKRLGELGITLDLTSQFF